MGTMEENRKTVQAGLDKRKAKRKKAEEEAYQEAIETQMIDIVNRNYSNVDAKTQQEIIDDAERKHNKKRLAVLKKLAMLKKHRNETIIKLCVSAAIITLHSMLCAIGLIETWLFIAFTVLAVTYFTFNALVLFKNINKISKLK